MFTTTVERQTFLSACLFLHHMNYKPILQPVLKDIVPSAEERSSTLAKVNKFLSALNSELKRVNVKARAVLGGSYAKDTWLSGDYDVDVFVAFDLRHKEQNLSDLLERALKKWKHERIHGSRDYFWIRDGLRYEIVPVLDIKKPDQAENVTDFSPLHVAWVNKNGKKLKDDIRLAKKFCKGASCYGAESYIRGFSGHVVDILTIYSKGFIPLLKSATKWKPKFVIDYYKIYKGKALFMMNQSKTEGPLVLVDPVQPGRNSAASLTRENFDKFVKAGKSFLKRPSASAFIEKTVDFKKLKGTLVKVSIKTLDAKEDVAGTKFVRAFEHVRNQLSEFDVKDAGWLWDKKENGTWWFLLKKEKLSSTKEWPGPPVKLTAAVKNFKNKYRKTFVKKNRIFAVVDREFTAPVALIRYLLKGDFVKSRVKSARL